MSEKCTSTSPSAFQVKNWQRAISIEGITCKSQLDKGERIVDIRCNVRLADNSLHTIHDYADRVRESAKSGIKVVVHVARLPQSYPNEPYQNLWM